MFRKILSAVLLLTVLVSGFAAVFFPVDKKRKGSHDA